MQGADYFYVAPVETRIYHGSTTLDLLLDGESLVSANLYSVTVTIAYHVTSNLAGDSIDAYTPPLAFADASGSSSARVRAVAAAFLADVYQTAGVSIAMDTLQPATQGDFGSDSRYGGFFDLYNTHADPDCP